MPIGEDAIAGYAFHVQVDGEDVAQFKECSGLSVEFSVIEHRENRDKGMPIIKKLPGAQKWGDITLKRGTTNNTSWWSWIKQVEEGDIDGARKGGSIILYDYQHGEQFRVNFQFGWPSKISIGNLQAGSNDVALSEVTITHEGLFW